MLPRLAVSLWVNAKNLLHSVHGFPLYHLVVGKSPKVPSTLSEKAPALTCQPVSEKTKNQNPR